MNKIPVGRTIAQAYGFAFGRYFTALSIVWLPFLASAALSYYFRDQIEAEMLVGAQRVSLLVQLASLVLVTIMSVGITKEVLGLPRGFRFFYAGFGAAELRVLAGYFAFVLLFIVFVIALVIVAGITAFAAGGIAGQAGSPQARMVSAAVILLVVFVIWLALLFIAVRLTFLFLPATVAEHRIGILRSWELTQGNFWRIFVIGLAVVLPLLLAAACVGIAILGGSDFFAFAQQHAGDQAAIRVYAMERTKIIYESMPLVLGIGLLVNPIVYGLVISPAAFAYRALVPDAMPASRPGAPATDDLPAEIHEVIGPDELKPH